jgi:hypothetical protein
LRGRIPPLVTMIRIGQRGRVTSRLSNVVALNREGLNVSRGIETVAVLAVPFVVFIALDEEKCSARAAD